MAGRLAKVSCSLSEPMANEGPRGCAILYIYICLYIACTALTLHPFSASPAPTRPCEAVRQVLIIRDALLLMLKKLLMQSWKMLQLVAMRSVAQCDMMLNAVVYNLILLG